MVKPSWDEIRQQVYEHARGCCEYCQTCEVNTGQAMQVDHIDPFAGDALENLCLACWSCNNYKRRATFAPDPLTNELAPLFNPRTQLWAEHFMWVDDALWVQGMTPIGRATVARLKMNRPSIVAARQRWRTAGYHSPTH